MNDILLEIKGLTKRFPGTLANDHIDIKVNKGEVHSIVGENGAGKSTFCNILIGDLQPDEGEIVFNGNIVQLHSTADAIKKGISMVHQERNLVPFFTGAENILLGNEPVKVVGLLDKKNALKEAQKILTSVEEKINLPLNKPVKDLSQGEQQLVEIIRSIRNKNQLLILDEPTSSLSEDGIKLLFRIIKKMTTAGTTVIFVSHKLEEVFYISDTISVFRNGKCVATKKSSDISEDECISLMVNRSMGHLFPNYSNNSTDEILIEVENISDEKNILKHINFRVRKGEKIGWYGLVGSGRTELAELIMGLREKKDGILKIYGEKIGNVTTMDIRKKGIYLIPEDRRKNAEYSFFSVGQNVGIAYLEKISSQLGFMNQRNEYKFVEDMLKNGNFPVKYGDVRDDLDTLSGGNKQKLVLSRGIYQENLKFLIADEPTQGIDIGAKYDIYELFNFLSKRGIPVIFISSELPELIGICDRIFVFYKGTIIADLPKEKFNSEQIVSYAFGMNQINEKEVEINKS